MKKYIKKGFKTRHKIKTNNKTRKNKMKGGANSQFLIFEIIV